MEDKKISTYISFKYGTTTIEQIVNELPFLKKLEEIPPESDECDNRTIEVNYYDKTYTVTENQSGFGGEGGVETVNFYLGRQIYRKESEGIKKVE